MDMQNKRFEGEKKLSEKLLAHDQVLSEKDLLEFDAMLDKSQNVLPFWMKLFGVSFIVAAGMTLGWMSVNNDKTKSTNEIEKVRLGQNIMDHEDLNFNHGQSNIKLSSSTQQLSIDTEKIPDEHKTNAEVSKAANVFSSQRNKKGYNQKTNYDNVQGVVGKDNFESTGSKLDDNTYETIAEDNNLQADDAVYGNSRNDSNNFSSRLIDFDFLPYLNGTLDYERAKVEVPAMVTDPIEVLKEAPKRISFGIQYNLGRTHAGYHETPWVSVHETIIEGVKSYGYGLFGQINIDRRSFVRASFTYNKMGHRQMINDLRYQSGITSLVLELYSHELKFGADYGFRILPNLDRLDINIGGGLAYHNVISEESNNYWTEFNGGTVKDLNELKLSPLSYKAFVSLEVGLYKDVRLGVEPYVIYQKRSVRYTNSIFIADVGDYDISSGLNFTVKF